MADLNSLIAQGTQFNAPIDPFAQYAKMQQLEQGQQANMLARLKMDEYQRGLQEQNNLRNAIPPDFDPSNPTHVAQVYRAAPTLAPGFVEKSLLAKKTNVDIAKDQAATIKTHIDNSRELLSGVTNQAGWDAWRSTTLRNLPQLANSLPEVYSEKSKNDLITKADDLSKKLTTALHFGTTGGQTNVGFNPFTGQKVSEGVAATMTPYEEAHLPIQQAQLKVAQDRLNAEMATGNLTPDTIDFLAETYRQTGQMPPMGIGSMAAAARSKVLTRAAELSMGGGKTAEEAAGNVKTNKAETAGMTAGERVLGSQIANVQVAANEANKMINVAKPYVDKVNPSDYPALNAAGNFVAKNTGDPNIVGLATSLNSLVNAYARAINPKGTATVSDKNHAREIINTAMSKGQLNEAFNVMGQEMQAALASGPETRAAMRSGSSPVKPTVPSKSGATVSNW